MCTNKLTVCTLFLSCHFYWSADFKLSVDLPVVVRKHIAHILRESMQFNVSLKSLNVRLSDFSLKESGGKGM